jgi:uncharacterized repeat protein (TIGR03803 family)
MKTSILETILAATTLPKRWFALASGRSHEAGHVRKLSLSKMGCMVSLFCAAAGIVSPSQTESPVATEFKPLVSFEGENGANPGFVNLVQGKDGNLYGTTEVSTGTGGTVFKISPAGKLTTIHVFCTTGYPCPDGEGPYAGLTLASNGKFYGTTYYGGTTAFDGTVFQITLAGKLTTLHRFKGTDGAQPQAPPVLGSDGKNLYGPTVYGGSKKDGTLYEMSAAGGNFVSVSFTGANGVHPYAQLVQGKDGNFYGTTAQVTSGNGTVFAITENDGLTTLHTFHGGDGNGGGPNGGLIQATNGLFYGTTSAGGAHGKGGTVFSITPAGKLTTIHSFCGQPDCADGANPLASLVQGSDGNLYGTTYHGGTNDVACNAGCGTIFRITTAGKFTKLYNFCSQSDCTDGTQPEGGLVQHTNGTFYGTAFSGGSGGVGTVYSLSVGLGAFVKTLQSAGKVGGTVTVLGTNLTGVTKVSFNGIPAVFGVVSDSEITATVPTGAATGMIEVTTPSGTLKSNVSFVVTP